MPPYDDFTNEYEDVFDTMRRWLRHSSRCRVSGCRSGKMNWSPAADIHETDNEYHLFIELAGVDPATVQLTVDGNTLYLNGERHRLRIEDCNHIHQLEISYGDFRRVFQFPSRLDADRAQSSYRNGILEVIVPKLRESSSIPITFGDG